MSHRSTTATWVTGWASRMPAEDAANLLELFEWACRPAPSEARRLRLEVRDAAIRRAAALYDLPSIRATADAMESDLLRPITTRTERANALREVLDLSGGKVLSRHAIRAVLGG